MGGEPLGVPLGSAIIGFVAARSRSGSSVLALEEGAARSKMSRDESTPEGESTKP